MMKHDYYIETLLSDSDPFKRRLAAEELMKLPPDREIIRVLAQSLMDTDRGVSDICAYGLTQSASVFPEYITGLIAPYIADKQIERRNLAGELLLQCGESASSALVPYLSSSNPDVRKFSCDLLGLLRYPKLIPHVARLLEDSDINVRCSAVESLGYLHAEGSLPTLFALYEADEKMRPYIMSAAGEIGGKAAEQFLLKQLQTDDDFLRLACIDALAVCGSDITIASDLLSLLSDVSPGFQLVLLKTIYGIAFRLGIDIPLPDEWRSVAHRALTDNDGDMRMVGLLALGNSFLEEDVPALLHHLMLSETDVQQHIMRLALTQSSPAVAIHLMRRLFSMLGTQYCTILETLSYLPMLWQEMPAATVAALTSMFFAEYETMDSEARVTLIDIILSVERASALRLLERELGSEDKDRIHDALISIEHYHLQELALRAQRSVLKES